MAACPEAGSAFASAQASGALDGATLRLADGQTVRLAGVVAASEIDGEHEMAGRARAALDALIAGKQVVLYGRAERRNRYGYLVAQVAVAGEDGRWVQAGMVAAGMVRAAPEAGEVPCALALLAVERRTELARLGIWAERRFAVETADHIEALSAARGRFALVEGTVSRVGETSSRTYLDFGRRYSQDFSIIVPRAARAAFAAAGIDLKALRGRHVRVRGTIFSSGGPAIEIRHPASLEVIAGDGT